MSAAARRGFLSALVACAALFAGMLALPVPAAQAACELKPRSECFELESVGASRQTPAGLGRPGTTVPGPSIDGAGAHPTLTTSVEFSGDPSMIGEPFLGLPGEPRPWDNLGELSVELPAGLVGNPTAFPKCTAKQLALIVLEADFAACPRDAQVGVVRFGVFGLTPHPPGWPAPLYNMPSPGGEVAGRLGFAAGGLWPAYIDVVADPKRHYALTAKVRNPPGGLLLTGSTATVWGVPADPINDGERFADLSVVAAGFCASVGSCPKPLASGLPRIPFISNPTSCGPAEVRFEATGAAGHAAAPMSASLPDTTGCESVPFDPSFELAPSTHAAASPSGVDVSLSIPQDGLLNPSGTGVASAHLKKAVVTLPAGVSLNPAAADGLGSCSEAQIGLGTNEPASCPEAAKVGTVRIATPLLEDPLEGSLYLATPYQNPFGTLLAGYMVAKGKGVLIKQAGKFDLDPDTGQIVATFDDNPQQPFSSLELHFKGGPRGVITTPSACGTYQTEYQLTPWSGAAPVAGTSSFTIDAGCATGGFDPQLDAGSTSPVAGSYAPFAIDVSRADGEQNLASVRVTLPPGELAKLAGVALCPEAAAASGGCPPASQIGRVSAAVGAGALPLWIPQADKEPTALYLAGPYKDAPYSVVVKAPAQAGPFDLGTVAVRAALRVDPTTAQVSAVSDPLPQALQGVPIDYRRIHVAVDRAGFALNPTSCEQMSVGSAIGSDRGAIATPSSPFRALDCAALGFGPRLFVRLFGKTNRGAHPSLRAILMPREGDANIGRAVVSLPRSEFLDQGHIRTICTRVQFAADACPQASIYGHALADTPLLDRPLAGPVYLRSSDHELPDLVADLKGQVDFELVGRIDSIRGGIRTAFESPPDAPVSRFVLTMQGGKQGLLVNSRDICRREWRAQANLTGQNGKRALLRPRLRSSCRARPQKR
jgi:hypothetical protein